MPDRRPIDNPGCPFHRWVEYCPLYHLAHAGLVGVEADREQRDRNLAALGLRA